MENLSVIGIGRLGLCFSLTLERAGYNVVGCDINEDYVNAINEKTFNSHEPGVSELLSESKNFTATTDFAQAVDHGDLIFVTVRTESEPDGKYDHSQVESVLDSIRALGIQRENKHLVICSNVNPSYSNQIADRIRSLNWTVSYNPETIAQGTILKNQAEPDCVYIGAETIEAANQIEEAYKKMCTNQPTIHKMDRLSAELTKVSLNCYLTMKISFANAVGDLAIRMGGDPSRVLHAVGSDSRINNKYFRYGFGYGGPCFPRDNRAFIRCAEAHGQSAALNKAAMQANKEHLDFQVKRVTLEEDKSVPLRVPTVTYKPGVTIIEESQQLELAVRVAQEGYIVTIIETQPVIDQVKELYGELFKYEVRD
jgi:UDPglucose 6-dehydrogenase